jgi:signal transduction histidine kinase
VATEDGLVVSFIGVGAYRLSAGRWTNITPSAGPAFESSIVVDGAGAVWLIPPIEGRAERIAGTSRTEFQAPVEGISGATADRDGVIFAGMNGLARFDGHGFQTLLAARAPILAGAFGIAEPGDGGVWVGVLGGIVRIDRAALMRAFSDPRAPLPFELFDASQGFTARPGTFAFNGNMTVGPDHRVWFNMVTGLAWVDPAHLHFNTQPPPVVITSAVVNGRTIDMPRSLTLPAGTSRLEIDYTALDLTTPERVLFRYKLSGVDENWVDVGGDRQAHYTNVPPGQHRFQVIAANGDGLWNDVGATLTFTIPPTFLQSVWFKFIIALALATVIWLAYSLRLRQETARLQSRFDIRIAERERIARELHDTLLQGFQGLILRFQSVANRVPADAELRTSLDNALHRADDVLVEGRARVRELRAISAESDLAKSIVTVAHVAIQGDAPRFDLTVEGSPRPLHALVAEEVARIAEEAIRNAVQHAKATTIEALLSYGGADLRLTIRDDGAGMRPSILVDGKSGHFGLIGMRERAQRLGGRLDVTSREGAGTEVGLSIPARAAYKDHGVRLLKWPRLPRIWRVA